MMPVGNQAGGEAVLGKLVPDVIRMPANDRVRPVAQMGAHPRPGIDGRLGIQQLPAVRERIGGHVDDAHHQRPFPEHERTALSQPDRESAARIHGPNLVRSKVKCQRSKARTKVWM